MSPGPESAFVDRVNRLRTDAYQGMVADWLDHYLAIFYRDFTPTIGLAINESAHVLRAVAASQSPDSVTIPDWMSSDLQDERGMVGEDVLQGIADVALFSVLGIDDAEGTLRTSAGFLRFPPYYGAEGTMEGSRKTYNDAKWREREAFYISELVSRYTSG